MQALCAPESGTSCRGFEFHISVAFVSVRCARLFPRIRSCIQNPHIIVADEGSEPPNMMILGDEPASSKTTQVWCERASSHLAPGAGSILLSNTRYWTCLVYTGRCSAQSLRKSLPPKTDLQRSTMSVHCASMEQTPRTWGCSMSSQQDAAWSINEASRNLR